MWEHAPGQFALYRHRLAVPFTRGLSMPVHHVSDVRVTGLSAAVPSESQGENECAAVFGEELARKIVSGTGVRKRHIAPTGMCTSDLCEAAARRLVASLDWDPKSVDLLVFVSQTGDYPLPATSCTLQARMGLSTSCAAFDLNLGCSGYLYGLWVAATLLARGESKRALLLAGETPSRQLSPLDHSAAPLFGDAGTATAIEYDPGAPQMIFELGTDGRGARHAIIRAGGYRTPKTPETAERTVCEEGNIRSQEDLYMNGAGVLAFALQQVPKSVRSIMKAANWSAEEVDFFVLHQANRSILQYLAKRLNLPEARVVMALEDYGNTSSASIPLAISHALVAPLCSARQRLVLASFGNGFSWGSAAVEFGPMRVLAVNEVGLDEVGRKGVRAPGRGAAAPPSSSPRT